MSEINKHRPIPANAPPVQHNSGNVRSTPAGVEVSTDQYRQPHDSRQGFDKPRNDGK